MQDYGARTVEWVHPEPLKRRLYNLSLEYIAPLSLNLKKSMFIESLRGTQREYSSKPLKHGVVKRILVFKR